MSVRSICVGIGVLPHGQIERLRSNPTYKGISYLITSAGGPQETYCLPLGQLNLWLGSINPMRTKEPVRTNLTNYQRECAEVLYKHFMPRGELDLQPMMDRIEGKIDAMNAKFDYLTGMDLTVFGDDAPQIKEYIEKASKKFSISTKEVWGIIRRECDVSSYKLQNRRVLNFLKNLLGEGLHLVKEEKTE